MVAALRSFILTVLLIASSLSARADAQNSILEGSSKHFPAIDIKAVRKITCTKGHGTGFVIARGQIMTAYHVVANEPKCVDEETARELKLVYWNLDLDIAVLSVEPLKHEPRPLRIGCSAYETTGTFYSYGYAGLGFSDLMITRLRAIPDYMNSTEIIRFTHMRALRGVIVRGMSGGPIVDDRGRVVGMNNLTSGEFHFGLSREMHDTYLCQTRTVKRP